MNNTELRTFSIGLLILLLSGAACASATTVSIADATVEPGDVITLPIMIGNITDYGTGTINIEYDQSVAHITNVTSGPKSQIAAHDVNNTIGLVEISASNPYGVSGDIIFANVTFEATSVGSTPLNLNVTLLGDISYNKIPATVSDGSIKVKVSQPPKPFFIYGYVCYENGTPCNSHSVNITNLNTYGLWHSETSGGSNYYQISLSSGIDLNATEILRFDATDGTCSTSVTDHTVTRAEVDAGGFEYNISLESPFSDTVVSIGSTEGSVGDSVNVSINITDAPAICAMDIRVAYNASILGAMNVMNGSMIESLPAPLVAYHIGYVDINISFATYPEAINGDGELFIVTFDVVGGNAGDSSPLNLEAEAYMADLSPVALETVDGVVNVTDGAPDPAPYLITYTITNTTISPNGDGINDTEIDVEFSESVDAAIRIEDATGVVKTLYTSSGVTDPDPQTWDGTDDSGNIVADGTYQVNITMDDGVNPVVYNNNGSITVMPIIASVSIPDVSATGMITVPIAIANVSNAGSCQLTLSYDPDVVIVSSADHSDFDSMFVNLEAAASGSVSILAYQTSNPGLTGDVLFADVTFVAVGAIGSSTHLDLEVTTLTDATPDCNPIPYTVRNGSFTVFLNGDVNGDNRVDVADCMYLAKYLLGVSGFETIIEDAADVNGNGEVEASDCMFLAKHLAGMDGFEVLK